jgi:trimeric autotransporter adhesin
LKGVLRGIIVLVCVVLICTVLLVCLGLAQEPPSPALGATPPPPPPAPLQITGTVKSGKTPLPGVTVTASNTLTGKKFSAATAPDGTFVFKNIPRGRYVVKVEFMGFATVTQEVTVNPETPTGKADVELVLASRQQEQEQANRATAAAATAGRGFQNLAVEGFAGLGEIANGNGNGSVSANDLSSLPLSGAGADIASESVSVAGNQTQGRSQDFGFGNEDELQQRVQQYQQRMQQQGGNTPYGPMPQQTTGAGGPGGPGGQGGPGGPGGPGGGGGGFGGGGPIAIGRFGRNFNLNQPHGFLYVQDDNAALDSRPYSLNGLQVPQVGYNQLKVGAFIGSPLKIPGLFDWSKSTFITGGWYGTRGSTPYDALSTVPTQAERNGDFAGLTQNGNPVTIFNPQTGQPYPGNVISPSQFSSSAVALLKYIPLPNMPGALQNFQYVTTEESNTDNISFRVIHNFIPNQMSGPGPVMVGGPGGFSRGRGRPHNNLNIGFNYTRNNTNLVNSFPSLAGNTDTQGWNGSAHWVYGKAKVTNNLGFTYNHNRTSTTNLYSGITDVSGEAGIVTPIPSNPFNWGLPGITFSSYGGLSDPVPSRELDQTYTFSDTVIWNHGKSNWRFGGDYRRIMQGFRSARNANGTFIFTGFATSEYVTGTTQAVANTGNDFADFLLGLPQQTSLQAGTTSYEFRANSFDGFAQNDWRVFSNLSLNLGVRYEYTGPFTETQGNIANLDVSYNPESVVAYRILPGQSGPTYGNYPSSLVRPDRNNWAPRLGLAWRAKKDLVVRAGYGINYNLAQYGVFVHDFAFQPPFATTQTNAVPDVTNPAASPLTLENGFPNNNTASAVTNNYALDPNYRLGQVQIWNLDLQKQLPGNIQLNVGYNGAKGTHLDTQRALVPTCEALNDCAANEASAPFIFESSEGNSILHAGTVRIRKRMSRGIAVNAVYAFSKSIDDASSVGLGSPLVVQNPFDLPAQRGLSTFDQKHNFTGNWIYDLPFGDNRRFLNRGAISHILGGWQWSGGFTIGSGFYFTPQVLGATADINRGVSGSIRANVVAGQPVGLANPTTSAWFNTAAFCTTGKAGCVGPTVYGNAGRDIIEGPSEFVFNSAINKTITIRESRSLELRLSATNIFNTPYFSNINTVVNSLTYGQVTAVSNMRRITMVVRFRF